MTHKEAKKEALEFLMTQKGGVLSTISEDQPQSSYIYYDANEDFSIYFPTVMTSRKHSNIQANKKVAFNVSTINPPRTLQIEGVIEPVPDRAVAENALVNYADIATSGMKYEAPITKMDWEKGVVLYKIKPTWVKWSDYSIPDSEGKNYVSEIIIPSN